METKQAEAGTREATGGVEIDAPIERVWRALTEAEELERWFPLKARVEPGADGAIWMSWGNEFTGSSRILGWDPPRHLRTTWDEAQVTDYMLESRGGRTVVRVVTSGFPADATWDAWVEGTNLGWLYELRSLKHYLERHAGEDRDVVYVRRRVRLSPDEAWSRLFGAGGLDASALAGERLHDVAGRQIAVILDDPADALLRVSLEPSYAQFADPELRDVTFFLSAWGAARDRARVLEANWRQLLERLYPEGRTM